MKKKIQDKNLIAHPSRPDALVEKHYWLDLFDTDFFVLIGDHSLVKTWAEEVLKGERLKELLDMIDDTDLVSRGRQYHMKGGGSVIWLKPGEHNKYLVHEVVHAAAWLFQAKGIPLSRENDEILAYTIERLYERFL